MKKLLALITAFVIASGYQSLSGKTFKDWTYSVTDNQATITGYSGAGGAVEIPAELDGVPVVKVEGSASFQSSIFGSSTTSITIPDSVTSIGDYAFQWCTNLTSINIPDSVTSIGFDAFQSCNSLESVSIGNSVTSIGVYAFLSCPNLTSITIPDSVTNIGDDAFDRCDSLTSVTLPIRFLKDYSSYGLSADQVLLYGSIAAVLPHAEARLSSDQVLLYGSPTALDALDVTLSNNFTVGQTDVISNPASYSLYTASDVTTAETTARTAGQTDVTGDPATYSLYTAAQLADSSTATEAQLASARTTGQNDITSDPATYSLYTASDVTSAEDTARTAGQTDVTGDPATYSLFTAADVTGAETAARTLGQQDVVNAPSSFDLYTASDLVVPKFLNLSNRAYVGIGDEILIGSMMILDKPMRILVRVAGPSLANGADPVPNPLLDPTVQLVRLSDGATIKTNDNWEDDLEQKTLIESTGIPPSDSRESAMVTTVDPGAYSFVVRGAGDTTGFANLEIYEFAE